MDTVITSTLREIKSSLGRYLAILTIIALGVGFFAGLRFCRPMLVDSAGEYFTRQNFYDYLLMCSLGYSEENVFALAEDRQIQTAEGVCYEDVLITQNGSDLVFKVYSITQSVNKLQLISGRMPERANECVVDADYFTEDVIGQTLCFSASNTADTLDAFNTTEFTVVGTVTSPLYISGTRGTSSLGNGQVAGCVYIDRSCFEADYYKEIYLTLSDRAPIYSDAYDQQITAAEDHIKALGEEQAQLRYKELVLDNQQEIDEARQALDEASAEIEAQKASAAQQAEDFITSMGFSVEEYGGYYRRLLAEINTSFEDAERELAEYYAELDDAQAELDGIDEPSVYVLTRDENAGYAAFEQDSAIIEKISIVFPAFFFLVAALVCVTTMTRMVDEQRTQIGVWKAMGYGSGQIAVKYVAYAGSAGLIGSVGGFFLCTYFIPQIFWFAYSSLYNFTEQLTYTFEPPVFLLSLVIAILCTAGVGFYCCWKELRDAPATILRPKAPKNGKRILLERIHWLWRRISFLHKVSLRNVVRYKQRFFLMILGVSGCTALLLTGFGIRDSIQNVTDYQYGEISLYDAEISFADPVTEQGKLSFARDNQDRIQKLLFLSKSNVDITSAGKLKSGSLTAVIDGDLSGFIDLKSEGEAVAYPDDGQLALSQGIAGRLGVKVGDSVTLTGEGFDQKISLTVSGIFENYIGDQLFVTENTMIALLGEAPVNAAYALFGEGVDQGYAAAELLNDENVGLVSLTGDMRDMIDSSFSSLNIVVVFIILCAGTLAFIVLFNLININIGERVREIATIKVLGFYSGESSAYVFREVNMLTALGTALGLVLGKLLHAFVMNQIQHDGMYFDIRIAWQSYVYSVIATFVFALLVRIVMSFKLRKISMTESLKSVE